MRHKGAKHLSAKWSKSTETPIGPHLSVIDPNDWARSQQQISLPTHNCIIPRFPEVVNYF